MRPFWPVTLGLALLPLPALALIWDVTPDGTGHVPTIQDALDTAAPGDSVRLAPGTFRGPGNRELVFGGKAILLFGDGGPDACILDCELGGRAFTFHGTEGRDSEVRGLAITRGLSNYGGAVDTRAGSSPTFRNVRFVANEATIDGGAIRCEDSQLLLVDCRFEGNVARYGGGLFIHDSWPELDNCVFFANTASVRGGATYIDGSYPVFRSCTLVANNALEGAAFFILAWDTWIGTSLLHCIIADNGPGTLIECTNTPLITVQCTDVWGNSSGDWAGCLAGLGDANGNLSADPLFCDPDAGSFYLQWGSPCLPANSPSGCELIGALGAGGCNSISVTPETWGQIKAMHR